jgi:hypothetical protein
VTLELTNPLLNARGDSCDGRAIVRVDSKHLAVQPCQLIPFLAAGIPGLCRRRQESHGPRRSLTH